MTLQLKTKVQSLETLVYAHSSKIADIETFDSSNKEYVDELVNILEGRVEGLETSNTTINNSLGILNTKINVLENDMTSNDELVNILEGRIDGLETGNTTINNSLDILNTKINVLESDITSNVAETDTDRDYDVVFAEGSGDKNLNIGSNPNFTLKFNPNSGTLRVPTIIGNVSYASNANYSNFATNSTNSVNSTNSMNSQNSINAQFATTSASSNNTENSSNVVIADNNDNTDYTLLFGASGNKKAVLTNSNIKYNPFTKVLGDNTTVFNGTVPTLQNGIDNLNNTVSIHDTRLVNLENSAGNGSVDSSTLQTEINNNTTITNMSSSIDTINNTLGDIILDTTVSITDTLSTVDYFIPLSTHKNGDANLLGTLDLQYKTASKLLKTTNIEADRLESNFLKHYSPIMTSPSMSGYIATASSKHFVNGFEPYRVFDNIINCNFYDTGWQGGSDSGYDTNGNATSVFTTNVSGYGNINGEWVQIEYHVNQKLLPVDKLEIYLYAGVDGIKLTHEKIYLVGSQNGSSWEMVYDSFLTLGKNISYQIDVITRVNVEILTPTNLIPFRFYRYIINKMPSKEYPVLNELRFYTSQIYLKKRTVCDDLVLNTTNIALGTNAGGKLQKNYAVAVGNNAGNDNQGESSIALGNNAGKVLQKDSSIAIGNNAGNDNQGGHSIALGTNAGQLTQKNYAVAIGFSCGYYNQGANAIAIGNGAGSWNQFHNSIAIGNGAGSQNQNAKSIILNATGAVLNSLVDESFVVKPIRNIDETEYLKNLNYDYQTGEISYSSIPSKPRIREIFATVSGATTDTTISIPSNVDYLNFEMIAGGGSGATAWGILGGAGGGQAGFYLKGTLNLSGVTSIVCSVGKGGVASTNESTAVNGLTGGATSILITKNGVDTKITVQGGAGGIPGSVVNPSFAGAGGFNLEQTYTVSGPSLDISPVLSIIGGGGGNGNFAITGTTYSVGGDGASSYFGGGGRGATSTSYKSSKGAYGSGGGGGSNNSAPSNGNDGIGIFTYIE